MKIAQLCINIMFLSLPVLSAGQSTNSAQLELVQRFYWDDFDKKHTDKIMAEGYCYRQPSATRPEVYILVEEGRWKHYYFQGSIESEGEYRNGVKNGEWKYYDTDGQLTAIRYYDARNADIDEYSEFNKRTYSNAMRTGIWKSYEHGKLFNTTDYNKGLITNYDLDGKIIEQIVFKIIDYPNGNEGKYQLRFGSYVGYYSNGQKMLEGSFDETSRVIVRGSKQRVAAKGVWTSYWPDGKPANFYNFNTGEFRVLNTQFMENHRSQNGSISSGHRVWADLGKLEDSYLPIALLGWTSEAKDADANLLVTMMDASDDILIRTGVWEFKNERNVLLSRLEYNPEFFGAVGAAEYYYPDGKLKSKGRYDEKSDPTGKWLYYFDNGNLSEVKHYLNGKLQGPYVNYFRNGNRLDSSNYTSGKIDGIRYMYHPSGKVLGEEYFANGNFISLGTFYDESGNPVLESGNGLKTEYYDNGKPRFIGNFKDHKTNGLCRWYYSNGNLSDEEFKVNGISNGEFKVYFESGALMQRGYRVNAQVEGRVEYFYPSGKPLGSSLFSKNEFATTGEFFAESGTPMLRDGTGTQITYGTNGKVNFKAFYRNYCRDGLAEWFHDNGQLSEAVIFKYSEAHKPFGLRWTIVSSFTRDGKTRDGGTLNNGNGTWIRYDKDGKATTTRFNNGLKVD